jgi:hypothetical protein
VERGDELGTRIARHENYANFAIYDVWRVHMTGEGGQIIVIQPQNFKTRKGKLRLFLATIHDRRSLAF